MESYLISQLPRSRTRKGLSSIQPCYLQMMQAAVDKANKEVVRIRSCACLILRREQTLLPINVFAFDENRLSLANAKAREANQRAGLDSAGVHIPQKLLPRRIAIDKATRCIEPGKQHITIVYQYVEDGENNPSKVEVFLDFKYLAEFCFA